MHLAVEFLESAALILALCFSQRFVVERWPDSEPTRHVLSGLLFGVASVVAMSMAVALSEGVIFDARSVVLATGALFGGPVVAAISATIAGAYRLYLGGDGAIVGLMVIVSVAMLGVIANRLFADRLTELRAHHLLGFGVGVHVVALSWFAVLPIEFVGVILPQLALPYVTVLSLATVAMGVLLREIEKLLEHDRILGESRQRFRFLFDTTATALLEEDVSAVHAALARLRREGVRDLRGYLADHPEEVASLAGQVRILHVNPAAVALFRVASQYELKVRIDTFFGPDASATFVDELCAMWDGAERFQRETTFRTGDGETFTAIIALPLPRTPVDARHVPVSVVDITAQKQAEREIAAERRRLEEVLWGTDVGTWEWNVRTGETAFNERWAQIAGYSLDELAPISIETWKRLTHPDDLAASGAVLGRVFARELDFYECEARMRHRDGTWVWVLDRGTVVEWDDRGAPLRMSGTHMDITRRKLAEERVARLSSVRDALLKCHAAILAADDEAAILETTVRTLVAARGYSLVWIGVPEDVGERLVRPVAQAGEQVSYLDGLRVHWSDDDLGNGPTGRAVRTRDVQVAHDLASEANFGPWSATAKDHSLRSSVAAPIQASGELYAVLNIYSSVPSAFVDDELGLIREFSDSLGVAIRALRLQADTARLHAELEGAALGAVRAIAATIEKRDPYTAGHQENVASLAVAVGTRLGWPPFKLEGLRLGAMIHDIGKIYIPAEILNRPGRLSKAEFDLIKSHPTIGYEILENTSFPWPIKDMVVQHHERLDGSGYPKGLTADQILDEAKVMAVADVVDAINSHRPYRPGLGMDRALAEIESGQGTIYDPAAVDACVCLLRDEGYRFPH